MYIVCIEQQQKQRKSEHNLNLKNTFWPARFSVGSE
jgi:hypothetical protein